MKKNLKNNTSILISGLYIVATPIGNLSDFSLRAIQTLQNVDIIACEDTRNSKILLNFYQINKPLISYHDYSNEKVLQNIIKNIKNGKRIALISDAGSPLIADPGFKLVKACKQEGLYVTTIPGANAAISALQLSALSPQSFLFKGFLPHKSSEKIKVIESLAPFHDVSVIFYETAPRLIDSLNIILNTIGNINACVAREITKKFEEVNTDSITNLINHYQNKTAIKGEIVLILELVKIQKDISNQNIKNELKNALLNMDKKNAIKNVATTLGIKKNIVYNIALNLED